MIKQLRQNEATQNVSFTNLEWNFRMPQPAQNYLTSIYRDNTKCQSTVE